MLKSDLVQTDKHSIIILLAEKSPIFTSHKSYKITLPLMPEKNLVKKETGRFLNKKDKFY